VCFVVGVFPAVSETFVIDQVAQLLDRGVDVDIVAMTAGDTANVSRVYFDYDMASRTRHLDWPAPGPRRVVNGVRRGAALLARNPRAVGRALRLRPLGTEVLRLPYWPRLLDDRDYDVVHCHSGHMGRAFALAKVAFGLRASLLTTFYGADVSRDVRDRPGYYDHLREVGDAYFVMSEDMRRRVIRLGFAPDRVMVHPVSIPVDEYPHRPRALDDEEPLKIVSVGRFVEKKGFDDLFQALALARGRSRRGVECAVVGGGELDAELRALCESLGLDEVVDFRGYMPMEDILDLLLDAHVLVQASKTAADGDME
jgi:colanic acid/amylovoran biosynthesis glycosyltransferase